MEPYILSFQCLSGCALSLVFGKLRSYLFSLGHGGLFFHGFVIFYCKIIFWVLFCSGNYLWALNCGSVLTE